MEKNQLVEMLANTTPEELAKAAQDAMGLGGIRIIKDLWSDHGTDMHTNPERNDTKTGPAMHSSGAGADKAVNFYSNPAPQVGLVEQYEDFTKKNIEGWGNLYSAMKAWSEKTETGLAALLDHFKKAEEEKKEEKKEEMEKSAETDKDHEKKEEMKGAEPASNPDPATKSKLAEKTAALWTELGELEAAYAKAEGHDEKKDIKGLDEAREHIEKAEKELEKVEEHEKEEQAHMKAMVNINLGWMSLAKATGLNAYDLKGYGNQKDEAVTGDSTADQSKHDLKKAEEKANYFSMKADRIRKSLGIVKKDETVAPAAAVVAAPAATADITSTTPAADVAPEVEALKSDMEKAQASMKAITDRVAFLNDRIEQVSGRKMTPMVPVVLKSAGIKSDNIAASLNEKIDASVDAGELTEDNAGVARSIVGRYMAVGKGHISVDIVNQQLERAPLEVQNFFSHLEATV
jgi:hypothetical protein